MKVAIAQPFLTFLITRPRVSNARERVREEERTEKQMRQREEKEKMLQLKASVNKWDTNKHLEGINTRKKINMCFSSSDKNLT